jgi:hypothetical protein
LLERVAETPSGGCLPVSFRVRHESPQVELRQVFIENAEPFGDAAKPTRYLAGAPLRSSLDRQSEPEIVG